DGIGDWSVTGVQTCALPIYGYLSSSSVSDAQIWASVSPASGSGTPDPGIGGWGSADVGADRTADASTLDRRALPRGRAAPPGERSEERRVGRGGRAGRGRRP